MFENILGHEMQKAFLQNYLKAKERPHALLFCGAEGLGKRQLALEFAKVLLCASHTGKDNCEACRLMNLADANFSHPDFLHVEREFNEDTKKYKDISIDQMRELNTQAGTGAVMSPIRVCLIEDADKMSLGAANSFLKLLEEPPVGWIIIMLATATDRLLPTILSRVVQLRFQSVDLPLVEQALITQGVPKEQALVLARLSEGSIGKAVRLYNPDSYDRENLLRQNVFTYREQAAAFLEALPLRAPMNYLAKRPWLDGKLLKDEAVLMVQLWQLLLHDLLLCKLQVYDRIYNIDLTEILQVQGAGWQLRSLKKALAAVSEAHAALESSVSVKVALEAMALKIDEVYKE